MTTVLFVGAGRHQRRAIEQARARGLRVAAVDRNGDAPGLAAADVAEVVDFTSVPEVVEVARTVGIDGALTVLGGRTAKSFVPLAASFAHARAGRASEPPAGLQRSVHTVSGTLPEPSSQ